MKDCDPTIIVTRHMVQSTPIPWPKDVRIPSIGREWRIVRYHIGELLGGTEVVDPLFKEACWGEGLAWIDIPEGVEVAGMHWREFKTLAVEMLTCEQVLLADRAYLWNKSGATTALVEEHAHRWASQSVVVACPSCKIRWFAPRYNPAFNGSECDRGYCGPRLGNVEYDAAWQDAVR